MGFEMNLVFCVLAVLTGSSQARGQSIAVPPAFTSAALLPIHDGASPEPLTEAHGDEGHQQGHNNPAGMDETSSQATTLSPTEGTIHSETVTDVFTTVSAAPSPQHTSIPAVTTAHLSTPAAADSLSSAPTVLSTTPLQSVPTTEAGALLPSLTTFSSQSAHTEQDASSTAPASATESESESLTTTATGATGRHQTTAPGRGPAGPTHQDAPSELNVGDEELKRSHFGSNSPLDPLLAGLLSVFIVTTAIVFVVLFLKFRQRTNHPEFHRLQDLPMDDLMEDTPLSRYTY